MKKIYFNGETKEYGCYIQGASVTVSDDYTMSEVVRAIKNAGYKTFILIESNMKVMAKVPENI